MEVFSLADAFGKAQALKSSQQEYGLREIARQEAERQQARDESLRQLYASGADTNSDDFIRQVGAIEPSLAPKFAKSRAELAKYGADTEKSRMAANKDRAQLVTNAAQSAYGQYQALPPEQRTPEAQKQLMHASLKLVGIDLPPGQEPSWQHLEAIATQSARQKGMESRADAEARQPFQQQNDAYQAGLQYRNQADLKGVLSADAQRIAQAQENAAQLQRRGKSIETEMKMSDDFKTASKDFIAVKDAYARLKAALPTAHQSSPSTLAAATTMMKMLDPGSVVRESELGMALATTGAIDRLSNYFNTLKNGRTLTNTQVQDFGAIADKLYVAAEQGQKQIEGQFRDRAGRYDLNPDNVTMEFNPSPPASPYRTKEDVRAAFQSGQIDRAAAVQILRQQFGGR